MTPSLNIGSSEYCTSSLITRAPAAARLRMLAAKVCCPPKAGANARGAVVDDLQHRPPLVGVAGGAVLDDRDVGRQVAGGDRVGQPALELADAVGEDADGHARAVQPGRRPELGPQDDRVPLRRRLA